MPSLRRRASVIDGERVDDAAQQPDRAVDAAQARALAEEAEIEAAEAEATAAAARARARALRLRRQAEALQAAATNGNAPKDDESASDDAEAAAETEPTDVPETQPQTAMGTMVGEADAGMSDDAIEGPGKKRARSGRRWSLRRVLKVAVPSLATLCTLALLAASGYMVWQHRLAVKHQQQIAEYEAAARQSVVTLMSLDFNKAQQDVQRIIDNSTGQFRDDFKNQANDFVRVAQDSKVITDVSVNGAVVESMTDNSAVVLVSATSHVTNSSGAKQEPRSWRLSVILQREGGQIKMSKTEFVP